MKFYVVEKEKEKTFKFGTSRKTFKGNFVVESGAQPIQSESVGP